MSPDVTSPDPHNVPPASSSRWRGPVEWPTVSLPVHTTAAPESSSDTGTYATGPQPSPSTPTATVDAGPYSAPERTGRPSATAQADTDATPAPSRLPGPGAFDPGRRGVRVLAVVAVLVVVVAAVWAWRSRPQVEPVVTVTGPSGTTGTTGTEDPSGPAGVDPMTESSAVPAGEVVVAVAGKVRRPGLVRLPAGARVADAVEAAGGALPGVDVAMLNPARKVTDGELIVVGVPAPTPAAPAPGAAAPGAVPGGRVNLNTATLAQLDALPGVGPVLAQRIIEHRDQRGGFRAVSDLRQVNGIGDARYEELKDLVTV
ncbi:ComEA family DNA-binding protein [Micromonospora craniellae]|uniref:ComEA family DNA-binding protein n=2 Tax=Micromonospora craniellae TaxID=2294034 RepID=A0A372FW64_9ACTN|nr:helix-hairpin-helix domain-containing protein [Micromonospora craniellae]RFS44928.1 ComEA family DNA-binding protein [Micromonospora craniellae]